MNEATLIRELGGISLMCADSEPTVFGILDPSIAPAFLYYSYIPIIVVSLLFGLFVLLSDRGALQSRILLWITVVFSLLIASELLLWIAVPVAVVHFVWETTLIFHALLAFLLPYFAYTFIVGRDMQAWLKWLLLIPVLPAILLASTTLNLSAFDLDVCESIQGMLWPYIYGVETSMVALVFLFCLFRARSAENKGDRNKALIFGFGTVVFFGIFILANVLGDITLVNDINLIGPAGMAAFLGMLTYLIVKYRAFNIRVIGAQALIVAVLVFLFAALFVRSIENARYVLIGTLLFVAVLGAVLVRGVKREVQQRQEIERLAVNLEKANDRLKELDQMKSEFLSVATHQLRAPLTAIRGYASMVAEGDFGPVNEQAKEPLFRIMESGRNMANSIEDYLNVSRIEQGHMKFESAPFDLTKLADTVVKELAPVASRKGLTITLAPCEPVQVTGDVGKIKQVITNYIDNSIKYTPQGSIAVKVTKEGSNARFVVEDTGTGIAAEELPKLFSKFTRAKDANKVNTTGTGLGLYVAKQLIEGHKGKTWAESEGIGKGSRFIFEIPM